KSRLARRPQAAAAASTLAHCAITRCATACDFGQRKWSERGGARGCAWVVVKEKIYCDGSDDEDSSTASDSERADNKQYCDKCKPDGAKSYVLKSLYKLTAASGDLLHELIISKLLQAMASSR
ncbi:hypothetical protein THAOC_07427, partial [Thalassiosira oceanica]